MVSRTARGIVSAVRAWSADRCAVMSAAIAFYAAFSLAPLLVVAIAVAGFFFGAEAVQGRLYSDIGDLIGKEGAVAIQAMVANAWKSNHSGWAGLLSLVAIFIGASATFSQLNGALNVIWHAPPKERPVAALLRIRLRSFGLAMGIGFLLIILLIGDTVLTFATTQFLANSELVDSIVHAIQLALSFLLLVAAFTVLLKVLPDVHVNWRHAAIGALGSALLFSFGKRLFALYLAHAGTADVFGAAGSLTIIMMWLYFSAAVFLFGAEIASHWERTESGKTRASSAALLERSAAKYNPL